MFSQRNDALSQLSWGLYAVRTRKNRKERGKEERKEYLEKIHQYKDYVKEKFKPKVSQRKREELEDVLRNKNCSFAR